ALSQVSLRVDLTPAKGRPAPPLELPLQPNSWGRIGILEALWLGPDEWLVTGGQGNAGKMVILLDAAFDGRPHSIVDVSANRVATDLTGADRLDLLATGCPLDLHPRVWSEGACAQTLLARVPVLLQERASTTRLFVRPSFAAWLADWLAAAAPP
ncbi:MAG TPA: sarcosine oxidase subunit gamma family protein, partial [Actinomycetota bacterium]